MLRSRKKVFQVIPLLTMLMTKQTTPMLIQFSERPGSWIESRKKAQCLLKKILIETRRINHRLFMATQLTEDNSKTKRRQMATRLQVQTPTHAKTCKSSVCIDHLEEQGPEELQEMRSLKRKVSATCEI